MEQFLRDDLSAIELGAFDQGVSDAAVHSENMTANMAFALFGDSVRELGPNDNGSNLYCLYWSGVHERLLSLESANLGCRNPSAWRVLANIAVVVANTLTESVER